MNYKKKCLFSKITLLISFSFFFITTHSHGREEEHLLQHPLSLENDFELLPYREKITAFQLVTTNILNTHDQLHNEIISFLTSGNTTNTHKFEDYLQKIMSLTKQMNEFIDHYIYPFFCVHKRRIYPGWDAENQVFTKDKTRLIIDFNKDPKLVLLEHMTLDQYKIAVVTFLNKSIKKYFKIKYLSKYECIMTPPFYSSEDDGSPVNLNILMEYLDVTSLKASGKVLFNQTIKGMERPSQKKEIMLAYKVGSFSSPCAWMDIPPTGVMQEVFNKQALKEIFKASIEQSAKYFHVTLNSKGTRQEKEIIAQELLPHYEKISKKQLVNVINLRLYQIKMQEEICSYYAKLLPITPVSCYSPDPLLRLIQEVAEENTVFPSPPPSYAQKKVKKTKRNQPAPQQHTLSEAQREKILKDLLAGDNNAHPKKPSKHSSQKKKKKPSNQNNISRKNKVDQQAIPSAGHSSAPQEKGISLVPLSNGKFAVPGQESQQIPLSKPVKVQPPKIQLPKVQPPIAEKKKPSLPPSTLSKKPQEGSRREVNNKPTNNTVRKTASSKAVVTASPQHTPWMDAVLGKTKVTQHTPSLPGGETVNPHPEEAKEIISQEEPINIEDIDKSETNIPLPDLLSPQINESLDPLPSLKPTSPEFAPGRLYFNGQFYIKDPGFLPHSLSGTFHDPILEERIQQLEEEIRATCRELNELKTATSQVTQPKKKRRESF